jgi:hypothetical protein
MAISEQQLQYIERRKAERVGSSISAVAILGDGKSVDCVVTNHSAIGAVVVLADATLIPTKFILQTLEWGHKQVEVARRGKTFVGVRFLEAQRARHSDGCALPRARPQAT